MYRYFINFWIDKWCSTTSLSNIAGVPDGSSISDTISQFWTGNDWNIPLSLQQMPHFFEHIMIRQEQDIPNWIMDKSGRFTLKLVVSLLSLMLILLWLLSFMELYMLLKKLKRWVLLIYDLNVIMP